jgi:hypothetical protein
MVCTIDPIMSVKSFDNRVTERSDWPLEKIQVSHPYKHAINHSSQFSKEREYVF